MMLGAGWKFKVLRVCSCFGLWQTFSASSVRTKYSPPQLLYALHATLHWISLTMLWYCRHFSAAWTCYISLSLCPSQWQICSLHPTNDYKTVLRNTFPPIVIHGLMNDWTVNPIWTITANHTRDLQPVLKQSKISSLILIMAHGQCDIILAIPNPSRKVNSALVFFIFWSSPFVKFFPTSRPAKCKWAKRADAKATRECCPRR